MYKYSERPLLVLLGRKSNRREEPRVYLLSLGPFEPYLLRLGQLDRPENGIVEETQFLQFFFSQSGFFLGGSLVVS